MTFGFGITCGVMFLPALVANPRAFVENVFLYRPEVGFWGVSGLLDLFSIGFSGEPRPFFATASAAYGSISTLVMLGLIGWIFIRWRGDGARLLQLPAVAMQVLLALMVAASGIGPQYLIWLMPLAFFLLRAKGAVLLVITTSLFIFVCYTAWSGGFPWKLAIGFREYGYGWLTQVTGLVLWVLIGLQFVWSMTDRRTRAASPSPEG